jgi:membrane protein DedA with SNARE-associated domain
MRFTTREAALPAIVIVASLVVGSISYAVGFSGGYHHGLENNADLVNTKYNLDRAKACLAKHGLSVAECEE